MHHPLMRHVTACNNAVLPGDHLSLRLGGSAVGWVAPAVAPRLQELGAAVVERTVTMAAAEMPQLGRSMAAAGLTKWRDEAFDVRATPDGPVLATIDRGALPILGLMATGVHLNGLVRRSDGLHIWVGRRALDKKLDPGKLDHIVGGGVPAGLSPDETLIKEAAEEAGLPAALVTTATHRTVLRYAMQRPEGLRRDCLHCYDIDLPEGFTPVPMDGEVSGFELWPACRVLEAVQDGDGFKFNVNLVLIDLFLRLGMVEDAALASALHAGRL